MRVCRVYTQLGCTDVAAFVLMKASNDTLHLLDS